jgi:hypothetical protein
LRSVDKAVDAAEYKLKIAELTTALSDIKLTLSDAKAELACEDAAIEKTDQSALPRGRSRRISRL